MDVNRGKDFVEGGEGVAGVGAGGDEVGGDRRKRRRKERIAEDVVLAHHEDVRQRGGEAVVGILLEEAVVDVRRRVGIDVDVLAAGA